MAENGSIRRITESVCPKGWAGRKKKPTLLHDRVFNDQGRLVEERNLRRKHLCRTTYRYDRLGHLVEKNEYNSDHTPFFRYRYKYDRWGNQVEELCYHPDGGLAQSSSYRFNSKGDELERRFRKGESLEDAKYQYTPEGLLSREDRYENGKIVCSYIYAYDHHGNQTEERQQYPDGSVTVQRQEYSYNEQGLIVDQKIYLPDSNLFNHYTFQYDERGNSVMRCQYMVDGAFSGRVMKYDEQNRKLEEYWCDSNQLNGGAFQYRYDERGLLVEEHHLSGKFFLNYHELFLTAFNNAHNPQSAPTQVPQLPMVQNGVTAMRIDATLSHQISYRCTRLDMTYRYLYKYNEAGVRIESEETHYDIHGKVALHTVQRFNDAGCMIEEEQDGQRDVYTYDDHHNWIRKDHYEGGRLEEVHERQILYFE